MPIKIQCGSCGAALQAPDTLQGKRVPCPKCKQPIAVPMPGQQMPRQQQPQPQSQPAGTDFDALLGAAGGPAYGNQGQANQGYGNQGYGNQGFGQPMAQGQFGYGAPRRKKKTGLYLGLGAAAVVLIGAVVTTVLLLSTGDDTQANNSADTTSPDTNSNADAAADQSQPADNADNANNADTSDQGGDTSVAQDAAEVGPRSVLGAVPSEQVSHISTAAYLNFVHSGKTAEDRQRVLVAVNNAGVVTLPMRVWMINGAEVLAILSAFPEDEEGVHLLTEDDKEVVLAVNELDETDFAYVQQVAASVVRVLHKGNIKVAINKSKAVNSFSSLPQGSPMVPDALAPLDLKQQVKVVLPERTFGARAQGVVLSNDRSIAMVTMAAQKIQPGSHEDQVWLEIIDLKRNELLGFYEFPAEGTPFGVTSDDKGLFSFTPSGFGTDAHVDQWALEGDKIIHQHKFNLPFGRGSVVPGLPRDFGVVNDRVVYVQTNSHLAFIDMEAGEVVRLEQFMGRAPVAFSANGKYLAFQPKGRNVLDTQLLIINCETMELAATFTVPRIDLVAFSDSGTKLAILTGNLIQVLDAVSGDVSREFLLPGEPAWLGWSGDQYIATAECLIDLNTGYPVKVWDMFRGEDALALKKRRAALGNNTFLGLTEPPLDLAVLTSSLPPASWLAEEHSLEEFYLDLAGKDVSLDISETAFSEEQVAEVRKSLEDKLTLLGARVTNGAEIRLVCKTRTGKTETLDYRDGNRKVPINYNMHIHEIFLYDGNELLWEDSLTAGGPSISYGTVAEIRRSATINERPKVEFFAEAPIRQRMPRKASWSIWPAERAKAKHLQK